MLLLTPITFPLISSLCSCPCDYRITRWNNTRANADGRGAKTWKFWLYSSMVLVGRIYCCIQFPPCTVFFNACPWFYLHRWKLVLQCFMRSCRPCVLFRTRVFLGPKTSASFGGAVNRDWICIAHTACTLSLCGLFILQNGPTSTAVQQTIRRRTVSTTEAGHSQLASQLPWWKKKCYSDDWRSSDTLQAKIVSKVCMQKNDRKWRNWSTWWGPLPSRSSVGENLGEAPSSVGGHTDRNNLLMMLVCWPSYLWTSLLTLIAECNYQTNL